MHRGFPAPFACLKDTKEYFSVWRCITGIGRRGKTKSMTVSCVFLLEGSECSSTRRLDNTRDSAMLLTHSWFDVTVFTTCRRHQYDNNPGILGFTVSTCKDPRPVDLYLQNQLLHSTSSMNPQQGEEQLEVTDALRLWSCNYTKRNT